MTTKLEELPAGSKVLMTQQERDQIVCGKKTVQEVLKERSVGSLTPRERLYFQHTSLCNDAYHLMQKKNSDYAAEEDPYRGFRMFGLLGILVRMSDKLSRLRQFCENGSFKVSDEGLRDTILDLINYAVLFYGYQEDK